jgi:hypothetical protein
VRAARRARVYALRDGKAQPLEVQLGITDGSRTEVLGGDLQEDDQVIIGMSSSAASSTGVANPFQPQQGGFRFR